jgi:hypothetical protein
MPQPDQSARPSQVTVAGWAVAGASVLLVFAVFDALGQLDTVDMRDRLGRAISSGLAKDSGFTVSDATEVVRWCLYVSGVAAAVSSILGVYVLQGHRGARIGVTIAAVSIVLTASIAGSLTSFLGLLIGMGTALLWTLPARDWFAGRPITVRQPREPERRPEPPEPKTRVAWTPPPSDVQPPPTPGWGQLPPAPQLPAAAGWPPPQPHAYPAYPVVGDERPPQVRLACILTWIFSSITALGYAAVLVVLAVDKERLVDELKKSPGWDSSFDTDTVTTFVAVAAVAFIVWSLSAIVLAVLTWRRVRWAWLVLLASASIAGLVSVLALPYSLPFLAVIGASTGMLLRRTSRAWFAGPTYPGYPHLPPGPPPGPRPPVW